MTPIIQENDITTVAQHLSNSMFIKTIYIWVSPKTPSRKMGRLNSQLDMTKKSHTNIITMINTLNTTILT